MHGHVIYDTRKTSYSRSKMAINCRGQFTWKGKSETISPVPSQTKIRQFQLSSSSTRHISKKRKRHLKIDDYEDMACFTQPIQGSRKSTVDESLDRSEHDSNEDRRKSIRAKLMVKREHLLTPEEEQDIHTQADLYAMSASPDPQFFVLPDEDDVPRPSVLSNSTNTDRPHPSLRKKRRRNYGNANCYVSYHCEDDLFDNTKMLPLGTRLIKPPTKLVELVAQAVDGSPDGLLQVQQIYTVLQNLYPFFRYMERRDINSWRSSIRHALYQKWFRKIKFDMSYISNKGCYWAINHKSNPKEWTLPYCTSTILDAVTAPTSEENSFQIKKSKCLGKTSSCCGGAMFDGMFNFASGLERGEKETGDVMSMGLTSPGDSRIPSPVRDQDPVLSMCVPEWESQDICLSSTESGHGTMSPSFSSPSYLGMESPGYVSPGGGGGGRSQMAHHQLATPTHTSNIPMASNTLLSAVSTPGTAVRGGKCSPFVSWTPNWEEYGSYILSPENMSKQMLVTGVTGNKPNHRSKNCIRNVGVNGEYFVMRDKNADSLDTLGSQDLKLLENIVDIFDNKGNYFSQSSNDIGSSDSNSNDIEIIAEFNKVMSSPEQG